MLRDVLIVQVFGATALASAFSAAFQIPNLFRRLFGEGALSAAFIPEYTLTARRDHNEADKLASYTLLRLARATTFITVVVELLLLTLLLTLPHNNVDDETRRTSLKLMMLMFPFMPAICMAAILSAMLQVHGRFGASMSGAFILNCFIVVVSAYYLIVGRSGDEFVAYVLSGATVLSGFTQCFWFSRILRKNFTWRKDCESAKPAAIRMLKTFVPVMIGLGGLQISSFLDLFITMFPIWLPHQTIMGYDYPLDEKSNIILRSTQLIYQFPLGVFGVAVATAAFPMLARASDNAGLFLDTLRRGLRLSMFIGLPASVGLILIREDITRLLFSMSTRGFQHEQLVRSSAVLLGFAPAVWAFSLNQLLTRAFYAKGDTLTPVRVSLTLVVINFALNIAGIWFLKEAALAWSATVTTILQTCVLLYIAKKRFCPRGEPIFDGPTQRSIGRVIAAVLVMFALVLLTKNLWVLQPGSSRWLLLLHVIVSVGLGAGVYVGEALYSRSPELSWLISRGNRGKGQYRDIVVE